MPYGLTTDQSPVRIRPPATISEGNRTFFPNVEEHQQSSPATITFQDAAGSAKEEDVYCQVSPMSRWSPLKSIAFVLSGATFLAGCATEAPYVTSDYRYHQRGTVQICFDEGSATIKDIKPLADDICRTIDRISKLAYVQPYQCNWTAPTMATFSCVPRPGETPPPFVDHSAPMRHDPSLGPQ